MSEQSTNYKEASWLILSEFDIDKNKQSRVFSYFCIDTEDPRYNDRVCYQRFCCKT